MNDSNLRILTAGDPRPAIRTALAVARLLDSANHAASIDSQEFKGRREVPFTQARQEKFLTALAQGYSVTGAAKAAGVGKRTCYNHKAADPVFAEAWEEALDEGTDLYEDRMRELALEKGGFLPCMATLRARRPDKWRDDKDKERSTAPSVNIIMNAPTQAELAAMIEADFRMMSGAGDYRIPGPGPRQISGPKGDQR